MQQSDVEEVTNANLSCPGINFTSMNLVKTLNSIALWCTWPTLNVHPHGKDPPVSSV